MTLADRIARDIDAAAVDVENIRALSRTQPHCFAEDKDLIARRLKKLACDLRNTFGGAPGRAEPTRINPGSVRLPGMRRSVPVEVRRTRAA